MKKIGLTGGIGSGKTYVAEIFRHMGIPVFNSDEVARDIQNSDPDLQSAIAEAFGEVFLPSGELDRKKVAAMVFSDPSKLKKLNGIVHPAVAKAFDNFCRENVSAKYVIKEAAIIFETGIDEELDGTILITAPEHTRIERALSRDNTSEQDIVARIKRQWTDEVKSERADWIIVNDGERALLPQVLHVQEQILHS